MFGKKRMLVVAMVVLSIGSLMCALTSDIRVLIVGRVLQGMATAVVPLGISILRDELPPAKVGAGVAMMSSTLGIGAAVGLPLAGLVVDHADWHAMFWGATALALVVLALVVFVVRESPERGRGRFDVIGSIGLTAFLVCLLLAVSKGSAWGWSGPRTLALLAAAALIVLAWGAHQLRAATPLVDLRVTPTPGGAAANIAALFIGFSFYANSLSTAQLVQTPKESGYGLGVSVAVGGLCLLPGGVMMVVLSPVSTRLTASRGPRFSLALGAILLDWATWSGCSPATTCGPSSWVRRSSPPAPRCATRRCRCWSSAPSRRADRGRQRHQRPHAHHRPGDLQRRRRRRPHVPHTRRGRARDAVPARLHGRLRDRPASSRAARLVACLLIPATSETPRTDGRRRRTGPGRRHEHGRRTPTGHRQARPRRSNMISPSSNTVRSRTFAALPWIAAVNACSYANSGTSLTSSRCTIA